MVTTYTKIETHSFKKKERENRGKKHRIPHKQKNTKQKQQTETQKKRTNAGTKLPENRR